MLTEDDISTDLGEFDSFPVRLVNNSYALTPGHVSDEEARSLVRELATLQGEDPDEFFPLETSSTLWGWAYYDEFSDSDGGICWTYGSRYRYESDEIPVTILAF